MGRRLLPLLAVLLALAGCGASAEEAAPAGSATATAGSTAPPSTAFPRTVEVPAGDDLPADVVEIDAEPQRVAALTYETAELVAELGAAERLVMVPRAITNPVLSNHASAMAEVEQHAPTESSVDAEAVIATAPDLVLLSARHGLEQGVGRALRAAGIPVLVLPNSWATVADLATNVGLVGEALGLEEDADRLATELEDGLVPADDDGDAPRVLVLSNQAGRPFVTAGAAFPLEIVRLAGGQDASQSLGMHRTGPISAEQVVAAQPDALLLLDMNGSGQDAFTELLANPAVAALPAVAEERVLLLEGRYAQALGLTATVEGRDRIAQWLADAQ